MWLALGGDASLIVGVITVRVVTLTMMVMGQSITFLVAVKKNMVLECIRTLVIPLGMAYHRGTYGLGLLSASL
jgi:hypothetical protein